MTESAQWANSVKRAVESVTTFHFNLPPHPPTPICDQSIFFFIYLKQESKLPTYATYNISSLLKYIICTLCYMTFMHYAIYIKVKIHIFALLPFCTFALCTLHYTYQYELRAPARSVSEICTSRDAHLKRLHLKKGLKWLQSGFQGFTRVYKGVTKGF